MIFLQRTIRQYVQKQEMKQRQAEQLGFDYLKALCVPPFGLAHRQKPSALPVILYLFYRIIKPFGGNGASLEGSSPALLLYRNTARCALRLIVFLSGIFVRSFLKFV